MVVPIRSENREKVALVLSVRRCSEGDAPYPPHSTKHILRVFGENEPGELQLQKKALAAEYTKRFPSAEQARCLSIRENKLAIKNKLFKNNVGFKEINHSMNIIANILQGSELETSANIPSFFRGLIFSPDRKVVTGYKGHSGKRIKILKIPAGVELIENNALVDAKFDKLILPRELRQLGKYTLVQANGIGKDVASKAACERFAEVERLLEDHERVAHELVRLQGEEAKLTDVLRDWPVQVGLLEKAERLYAENENRAILTRLQKAREILGELEGIDKSDLDRPCPTKEDIASAKEAQREIMKLENKLCGMNLSAAVEMLGGYGLTVTSLRTGETVCADSGRLAITEAVKLVIPGVMELQLAPADVDAAAIEKEIGVQKDIVDGILAAYQQESIDGLEMLAERIQQARSTEKSVGDRLKMHLAGESLQELEARASAIITPVRDEETIAADIHAMCGKESIAAFIGGKNAMVEGYAKEYSSTETLAAAVDSKAKERREAETRMAEMPEIPEEYLHVTEPKAYLEKLKRSEEIADAECKDALKEKTAAERDLDSYQNEMDGEDLLENCERAQRELEEQKALLKHWFHIRDVFEEQKAQLRGNPMEDITKHFACYLGLISGGKVFPEFPQTDKLDMNIYSGDRLVNYRRLSEGTKETVYLAFRLAVLDHLFPNGGGVIVLDDPLTDMDEERVEQSCALIRDCAERHQVIFLTCREAYLPQLQGNVIRI